MPDEISLSTAPPPLLPDNPLFPPTIPELHIGLPNTSQEKKTQMLAHFGLWNVKKNRFKVVDYGEPIVAPKLLQVRVPDAQIFLKEFSNKGPTSR